MGQIYFADDISQPAISQSDGGSATRDFKVTIATMLAQTGAAGPLIGDVICLAPIPDNCVLDDYNIYIPELDSGTSGTLDLGDNQVLAGAVSGTVGTGFTTPATGTSFTLTASASTASFTATNGLLMIGGYLFGYASLSGSTFVTVYASAPGIVIPKGAIIQQAGNTAAYQAAAVIGQGAAGILNTNYNLTGTTFATSTVVQNAIPATYTPAPWNTAPSGMAGFAVPQNIGQLYLTLKIHASPGTAVTTGVIVGRMTYHQLGNQP